MRMELPGSVRLAAEFSCFPTWRVWRDGVEEVHPRDLGLSEELVTEIMKWDAEYQGIFVPDCPQEGDFESPTAQQEWAARGQRLAHRLADELRDVPEVTYMDERYGKYEWVRGGG